MSLKSYLSEAYGGTKDKRKKAYDKKNSLHNSSGNVSIKNEIDLIPIISERPNKEAQSVLWKNLDTNELVTDLHESLGNESEDTESDGNTIVLPKTAEVSEQTQSQNNFSPDKDPSLIEDVQQALDDIENEKNEDRLEVRELNKGEVQALSLNSHRSSDINKKDLSLTLEDPATSFGSDGKNPTHKRSPLGRKLYPKQAPENRFGICAGSRWDGIDRSNGFEAKWLKKKEDYLSSNSI